MVLLYNTVRHMTVIQITLDHETDSQRGMYVLTNNKLCVNDEMHFMTHAMKSSQRLRRSQYNMLENQQTIDNFMGSRCIKKQHVLIFLCLMKLSFYYLLC
jgi:hypothetical protein